MISTIIRICLTGALIYMVYGESGPWTAVAIGLIAANAEIVAAVMRANRQ